MGNISAKKYQNVFTYVKVRAKQRWDAFLRHSVESVGQAGNLFLACAKKSALCQSEPTASTVADYEPCELLYST